MFYTVLVRIVWLLAYLNVGIYSYYIINLLMGIVGPPVDEESMSKGMIIFGCMMASLLPFLLLWVGQNFNIMRMENGYNKRSESFFSIVTLVFIIVMLRMFYLQFFPVF